MFPIRDHNPSERVPFVTHALILMNVGIFAGYWFTNPDENALGLIYLDWGLIPARLTAGVDLSTLFSSMFIHAGFMHLAGNMLFLWIFGDNLEDMLGHGRFLLFYILGGMAASFVQVAADPASPIPIVGASGAIAAVMGGYLLFFPKARVDILLILIIFFRIFPVPAFVVLTFWFAMQLLSGWSMPTDGGGVAYWAHAGGFFAGFVMALPFWFANGGTGFWKQTDGHPAHPAAEYKFTKSSIPKIPRER